MSNSNKSQNKNSIIKEEGEETKRKTEDKAKEDAERKAQSIQDKAKQEAERKAQSIIQQAEDKAKQEAEELKQSRQVITTTTIDSHPQEESGNFEISSNNKNRFFDPFANNVSIWQNYSMLWMNLAKEIVSNTAKMTSEFENTIRKYKQHQTFD